MDAIGLTPKEKEVMNLVSKGLSNDAICKKLSIKRSTMDSHLVHIYQKYGLSQELRSNNYSVSRLRASLIYLDLATIESWE